ncbi:hypothetical protein SCP_1403260 [Sparassis crispa]|uniref:Uncharacterized protein n=1 Tax=Sparassis crispa TaxID=139825 RepID=A0A401H3B4_9APHY|nr:hypothetical protein SCP_1403260 [Sparassis crispa]GBE88918.1 hypothetical protein SCP_1403260 [Sparassis crispa]
MAPKKATSNLLHPSAIVDAECLTRVPVRPSRSTANKNPTAPVINAKQKRGTQAKIQADKARKELKKVQKAERRTASVHRIAEREDSMQRDDGKRQSLRPDLHLIHVPPVHTSTALKVIHDSAISSIERGEPETHAFAEASPEPSIPPVSAVDSASEGQVDDAGDQKNDFADSAGDSGGDLDYLTCSGDALDEDEDRANDSNFDIAVMAEELGDIDADDKDMDDLGMEPVGLSNSTKGLWKKFLASEKAKEGNKKKKTALRSQIIEKWKEAVTAPMRSVTSMATKCKAPASEKFVYESKRVKAVAEIGGLKSGWKRYLTRSENSSKTSLTNGEDSDAPIEGEFEKDEGAEVLCAARAAHRTNNITQHEGSITTNLVKKKQVGIVLKPAAIAEIDKKERGAGCVNKQPTPYWCNKDLPFPARGKHLLLWQRKFIPALISWAATLPDPFGSNSHSDFKSMVKSIWTKIFIGLPELDDNGKPRSEHPAIYAVAQVALRTYRRDIGKTALRILDMIWNSADMEGNYTTIKRRKAWIEAQLKSKNFLYLDLQVTTHPGAFRGPLIMETFAYHLQLTMKSEVEYGEPAGALALCSAAVQRALAVWKDEMNSIKEPDDSARHGGARNSKESFKDEPWGNEAKIYYNRTKGLKEPKWHAICQDAHAHLQHKNNDFMIDLTADSSEGADNVDDNIRMSEDDD